MKHTFQGERITAKTAKHLITIQNDVNSYREKIERLEDENKTLISQCLLAIRAKNELERDNACLRAIIKNQSEKLGKFYRIFWRIYWK